ncbi:zinc finger MYM-type protein 1-like protein, partial [Tanacetum coccineum]
MIRDNYKVRVEAEITTGVIETGQGLNHEITLISIGGAKAWLPVAPTTYGDSIGKQGGNVAFVTNGFSSWSKKYSLNNHVGEVNKEVLDFIITEIGDDLFSLLVDESSDMSKKEQMALVLRYVDRLGIVKERFAGVVHVDDTCSVTLKASIDTLFAQHKLSLKQVRGQGYEGSSNMRGEFN